MHTITNQYLAEFKGGINLRSYEPRKVTERNHDLRAARGIIMWTLIVGNVLIWAYVFGWWLTG